VKADRIYKLETAKLEYLEAVVQITVETGLSSWTFGDYEAELGREESIFIVALDESREVAAFVVGRIVPSNFSDKREAEIYNIGVKPAIRRVGLGSKLLDGFLKSAKDSKVHSVWLEVRSQNFDAIRFYENAGFEAVGERKAYYSDPIDDAIIMRSTI
jgi:ribosomal-protein-alanine N-acetyltransferase